MSWLFRGNNSPSVPPPPTPPDDDKKNEAAKVTAGGYSFDSSALERAAQAAKELERSKHARDAFELAKIQEVTKQQEYHYKVKEYEVQLEHMKNDQVKIVQEERRKTLSQEAELKKNQMNYQNVLAKKREADQLAHQARMQEEKLRRQEESIQKQEAMRRKTIEYESELRHKYDMERIKSEYHGKAQLERENKGIHMERRKMELQEERDTWLASIKTVSSLIGSGFGSLISDKEKIFRTVGAVTLLAGGFYGAKYGVGMSVKFIESRIGKPSLIRETSRLNVIDLLRHPILSVRRLLATPADALTGIVLQPALEGRLREIAIATRYTKLNKGFYRNVLMCGPPGTGKTMFAKSLAANSGMDYAIMTGGDVAPMEKEGVTALHKVFDWASTSRKGVLLFVDEADAFLRKRSQERIGEDMRAMLNAFLYRTGEQSKKFILVLASNQPEQFDWAINDRIDEIVEFPLPTLEERERLIRLYFDRFILQPAMDKKNRIKIEDGINYADKCHEFAVKTDGFSGREIAKIAVAWQATTFASADGIVTKAILDARIEESRTAHRKKEAWRMTEAVGQYQHSDARDNAEERDGTVRSVSDA